MQVRFLSDLLARAFNKKWEIDMTQNVDVETSDVKDNYLDQKYIVNSIKRLKSVAFHAGKQSWEVVWKDGRSSELPKYRVHVERTINNENEWEYRVTMYKGWEFLSVESYMSSYKEAILKIGEMVLQEIHSDRQEEDETIEVNRILDGLKDNE